MNPRSPIRKRSMEDIMAEVRARCEKHADERGLVGVTILQNGVEVYGHRGGYHRGDGAAFPLDTACDLVLLGLAEVTAELTPDELWALERPNTRGPRPGTPEREAWEAQRRRELEAAEAASRRAREEDEAQRRALRGGVPPQARP